MQPESSPRHLGQNNEAGSTTLRGATWSARHIGGPNYVLSVASGNEVIAAIVDFAATAGITGGAVRGIGAVSRATLLFRDPDTRAYVEREFDEQMEIAGSQGNIALKADGDGQTLVHLHTTLGRSDYSAIAGHLKEAWVRGAGEFFITASESTLNKEMDEETGLNIFTL